MQDAVQTLIDAVQELIQTHEAFEEEGGSAEKDAKEIKANGGRPNGEVNEATGETKEGDNEEAVNEVEGVRVENLTLGGEVGGVTIKGGQVEGLTEEVWTSLRREYPGAEFVVVTDQ